MNDKIYVQYGCGLSAPKSWRNFDASPTLLIEKLPLISKFIRKNKKLFPENVEYGNIVKGLPVKPESCDGIYASHILEHLPLNEFRIALKNTYKILKPGGVFRLVVPDLEIAAERYIDSKDSNAAIEFLEMTSLGMKQRHSGLGGLLRNWLGHSAHLWMWDYKGLVKELEDIGFTEIRRCKAGDCVDKIFNDAEDSERFIDAVAIECRKQ